MFSHKLSAKQRCAKPPAAGNENPTQNRSHRAHNRFTAALFASIRVTVKIGLMPPLASIIQSLDFPSSPKLTGLSAFYFLLSTFLHPPTLPLTAFASASRRLARIGRNVTCTPEVFAASK